MQGHTHAILQILELKSGHIVSTSLDRTIIIWSKQGEIINTLEGFDNPVMECVEMQNQKLILNCNESFFLLWEWNTEAKTEESKEASPECSNVSLVAFEQHGGPI